MLIDFYENDEIDPLVIIREYKTYYSFVEQMEKTDKLFHLTDQEKLTLEYLSKTILSGVRPDELEILRLFLEKNRITYSEVINNCKERYGYEITNQKIDAACDVLKGEFVTNSAERERFCHIDILEADGAGYLKRILSYAERLAHKDFYDQVRDIVAVGLARYKDKYSKPYRQECPFVLYEKYSRRDVSLLMDAGKDLSSTIYGMSRLGDDVFIFVTYHKEENTDEEKQYVDGKPDYADEFVDNVIFRWDSQIDKKLDGAYMDKVLNTSRKHLLVQKTDAENNFFYMGEFDIVDAYEEIRIKLCRCHSPSGECHQTVLRSCKIHLHTGIILKLIHHSLSYGIVGITFQNTIDSLLSRVCTTMTRIYDNDYISVRILCRHITGI